MRSPLKESNPRRKQKHSNSPSLDHLQERFLSLISSKFRVKIKKEEQEIVEAVFEMGGEKSQQIFASMHEEKADLASKGGAMISYRFGSELHDFWSCGTLLSKRPSLQKR